MLLNGCYFYVGFSFKFLLYLFFGSCSRLNWLYHQLSSARYYSIVVIIIIIIIILETTDTEPVRLKWFCEAGGGVT